jgi:MFS family permease
MSDLRQLLRVLRHRDFRLLWLANTASFVGDRIVTVALALFVIDLTGRATDLGFVLASYTVPLIGFLLIGGVIADRLPRHLLAVVTDLVRCVLHGLLALLIVTGDVRIWHVVVIGVLFGTAEAFYQPAVRALLPQTVPEDEIQEANAVTSMFANLSEFAGPALATALVLGLGPAWAFGLDAATFLVSAALLVRVHPRARAHDRAGAGADGPVPVAATIWGDVRDGFAEVRSRSWVWATLAAFCIGLFVMFAPLQVVGAVVAEEQYDDVAVYGYVWAAFGLGTIGGSLLALRWRPRYPMRMAMLLTLPWPFAIAAYAAGAPLPAMLAAMVIAGCGVSLFDVWWLTAIAERIPPDKLSRVTSYDWMVSLALIPLGFILAGPVSEAVGATELLLGGAAIGLVAFAFGLLPHGTRMLERRDVARATGATPEAHAHVPGV